LAEFKLYQTNKATSSKKGKKRKCDTEEPQTSKCKKLVQVPIDLQIKYGSQIPPKKVLSQSEFEEELIKMLIRDMQPLATVERPGFQQFCERCLPDYELLSRRTAGRRLYAMYEEHKKRLIEKLTSIRWVSCTADLWSAHKKAYLGITVHFIDDKTLQMHSAILACRRFKGSHTGDAIGHMISDLLREFGISKKVQNIVTDNAANFAKAFHYFVQLLLMKMMTVIVTTMRSPKIMVNPLKL
jgi:hypothetical protein